MNRRRDQVMTQPLLFHEHHDLDDTSSLAYVSRAFLNESHRALISAACLCTPNLNFSHTCSPLSPIHLAVPSFHHTPIHSIRQLVCKFFSQKISNLFSINCLSHASFMYASECDITTMEAASISDTSSTRELCNSSRDITALLPPSSSDTAVTVCCANHLPRISSFINRPTGGWIHDDSKLLTETVSYTVKYMGCVQVYKSMKSLNLRSRALVARECISCVTAAVSALTLNSPDLVQLTPGETTARSPHDPALCSSASIARTPVLDHSGLSVDIVISSESISLVPTAPYSTGDLSASTAFQLCHQMPNISFASGNDMTRPGLMGYIVKDSIYGRWCYVLDCGPYVSDVISTIGQAFEVRYTRCLQHLSSESVSHGHRLESNHHLSKSSNSLSSRCSAQPSLGDTARSLPSRGDVESAEYYNDLPGKIPPAAEFSSRGGASSTLSGDNWAPGSLTSDQKTLAERVPPADINQLTPRSTTAYHHRPSEGGHHSLRRQPWYHGTVCRIKAESLMSCDGDFLVRESLRDVNKTIMTSRQGGCIYHLSLVDADGIVKTRERQFDSVVHLIEHHMTNNLAIVTPQVTIVLRVGIHFQV